MSHIIGIDIGTSGIKVGAMNRKGELGFVEYEPYSLLYPEMGWIEIDLQEIWRKTKALLLKVWQQVELEHTGKVDAISLSTFCNSSVFLNEKGEPLYPGIMYLDQRSTKETAWIKEHVSEELLFKITKNRLEPGMYTLTTHLWFKNNYPSLYAQTYKWGNLSTYILHKLTGNFVMDWTQSSFSGMYDVKNYQWSPDIYEAVGIKPDKLPKVVDPCSVVGEYVHPVIASVRIPVVAGAADTACSTAALGIGVNEMFESVGTSNVLTACTDKPELLDKRFLNRCHVIKNRWLSHGAMSFPGAAIQWFYEQFLEPEGYSKAALEDLCKQSAPGSSGVFFLPYMQGERAPIWDPNARGVFVGIHLNTTKADMFRAVLEGCSFGLKQINEIIESDYKLKVKSYQSIGGGAKNREWAQIKATVLNKSVHIKDISETGVLGTCMIAGTVIGYFTSLDDAVKKIQNNTISIIEPDLNHRKLYEELNNIFHQIYPSLKTFFWSNQQISKADKDTVEDEELII